ncbi:MAG: hypothetical protein WA945_10135 [Arcobacteraceae bacterium]
MNGFTDEQLLNLVNNTIIEQTKYQIEDFNGGSVQLLSTNKHQLQKYKVTLFFGYKNNNSINTSIAISENLVNIWIDALMLKIKSLQIRNNGSEFKELNRLMNSNSKKSNIVDSNIVDSNSSSCSCSRGITSNSTIDSTSVVRTSYETTTTTITKEMRDYFLKKNTKYNIDDEFEKFKLYNKDKNNHQNIELNWKRWVDNIKVTSTSQNEKQDYSWNFKKLQNDSIAIVNWYFNQTQQQLPTFFDFNFEKFKEIGISCVRLEHPIMAKQVTIYFKINAESEQMIKKISKKN